MRSIPHLFGFTFHSGSVRAFLIATAILLAGCSPAAPAESETKAPGVLERLQQDKGISGKVSGLMTFDDGGVPVVRLDEMAVWSVPIAWMGYIFNGSLESSTSTENVTEQVHGSASEDGTWLESMSFSREVRSANLTGSFFRVTLRNVPVTELTGDIHRYRGAFSESGPEVRKYVQKIEYASGPVQGGVITGQTYISTNWSSPVSQPALTVVLHRVGLGFSLQQYRYASLGLSGLPFPADYTALPMPITWEDDAFNGEFRRNLTRTDFTAEINGAVSGDGNLLDVTYSVTVRRPAFDLPFRKVTITGLELSTGSGREALFFKKEGAELVKYLRVFEYRIRTSQGLKTVSENYTYTIDSGKKPSLVLAFGKTAELSTSNITSSPLRPPPQMNPMGGK